MFTKGNQRKAVLLRSILVLVVAITYYVAELGIRAALGVTEAALGVTEAAVGVTEATERYSRPPEDRNPGSATYNHDTSS